MDSIPAKCLELRGPRKPTSRFDGFSGPQRDPNLFKREAAQRVDETAANIIRPRGQIHGGLYDQAHRQWNGLRGRQDKAALRVACKRDAANMVGNQHESIAVGRDLLCKAWKVDDEHPRLPACAGPLCNVSLQQYDFGA